MDSKDACGNTKCLCANHNCTRYYRPTINGVPENINVSCSGEVPEASINAVTASDNVTVLVRISVSDEIVNKNCDNQYTIHRTWTATDVCGNNNTATQTITVQDTTASVYGHLPQILP